jgi:hypothetical protein
LTRIVKVVLWSSVAAYLLMWGVGLLPWIATLALELVMVMVWDRLEPNNRYSVNPAECSGKGDEDETIRIVDRNRTGGRDRT